MKERLIRGKTMMFIVVAATAAFLGISATAIVGDGLRDELGPADVAVVLGNKVEVDGTPSARLQARLDKAIELYKKGFFANIIVSGGVGKEGFDEAGVMRRYLVERGVPESQIVVDSQGNNTYMTAENAARIMDSNGWKSALVITQYFHVSRTRLALRRFGVSQLYTAHADCLEPRDIYSTAREVVAYYRYLLLA